MHMNVIPLHGTDVNGVPVRHMWSAGMPEADGVGAGFPVLESAHHALVFAGDRDVGAYNHHSRLTWHHGCFHAMWSNHPHGEDGPGQRVLHAVSADGQAWGPTTVLFPPPTAVRPSEAQGAVLTAFRWVAIESRLFAIAGCHVNVGYCDFDETHFSPVRDADHPSRARRGYASLAREVYGAGDYGPVFAVDEDRLESAEIESLPCSASSVASAVARLCDVLTSSEGMPPWDFRGRLGFPRAVDGHRLCEPTVYRARDARRIMLLRDTRYSHRLYVSTSVDGRAWQSGEPTDIPDSPSLTDSVRLADGTILLIGNQMAPAFDNPAAGHYGRDPLTIAVSKDGICFDRAFALRCGGQSWRVPPSDVIGRGGGGQYPSARIHEHTLYVQYSMGKEDIWVSAISLDALRCPRDNGVMTNAGFAPGEIDSG